jgi:hypothetical protein
VRYVLDKTIQHPGRCDHLDRWCDTYDGLRYGRHALAQVPLVHDLLRLNFVTCPLLFKLQLQRILAPIAEAQLSTPEEYFVKDLF